MIAEVCGSIQTQYLISLCLLILVCVLAIYALTLSSRNEQLSKYIQRKEKESRTDPTFLWVQ